MLNADTVARYEQLERDGKLTRGQKSLLAAHRRGALRGKHAGRRDEIRALGWEGILAKYPSALEASRGEGIPYSTLYAWLGPQPLEIKSRRESPKVRPLAPRQRRVLQAIADLRSRLGHAPSYQEIAAEIGVGSTNAVADHVKALVAKGYIKKPDGKVSRGIKLTSKFARAAEREGADGDEVVEVLAKLAQAREAIDAAEEAVRRLAQTLAGKRTVEAM